MSASSAIASSPSGDSIASRPSLRVDATGLVVAPGMVDAHVHGDLALFADPLHEPAVRQGVTTYIIGQDGVAMAPASPATLDHMRRYTAGFNGNFPTPGLSWRSMDEYLSPLRGRTVDQRRLPDSQRQHPHGSDGPGAAAAHCG